LWWQALSSWISRYILINNENNWQNDESPPVKVSPQKLDRTHVGKRQEAPEDSRGRCGFPSGANHSLRAADLVRRDRLGKSSSCAWPPPGKGRPDPAILLITGRQTKAIARLSR